MYMPTRLQIIYNKINDEIESIKESNGYDTTSNAFGHFFIKSLFNIDDQTANESLTDGAYDNGIDAIFISDEDIPVLNFFQFKYPMSEKNLVDGFKDEEIVKLGDGTQSFLMSTELNDKRWNPYLIQKHNEIRDFQSYAIKLWVVKYTNANITHQLDKLKETSDRIQSATLNSCDCEICGAQQIMELYESRYENIYPTITLNVVKSIQSQQFEGDNYKSINTVCSIKDLYEAVNESRDKIFDGNVRFYNPKTTVTEAIRKTLVDNPKSLMLLNNGITILCREANFNLGGPKFTLKSASIINGAQTVGSILDVLDKVEDRSVYEQSSILVRILEIKNDDDVINEIVNSLNTQTKMFSAYNISKDVRLRNVQDRINEDSDIPYFLEIKYNEFSTLKSQGKTKKIRKNVVSSEKMIQLYTAYENLKGKAYLAKLKSSDLLKDDELITKALNQIQKDDVVSVLDLYYGKIQNVITQYRKYIRNNEEKDILLTLDIEESEIDAYRFLTTGDILLLFTTAIIKKKYSESIDNCIVMAVKEIKEYIKEVHPDEKVALSNVTKAKKTFEDIGTRLHK